jgi:UDP-hydrolysing UDP-N-acetyl-D-glucosamine 2-epimerase
MTSRAPHRVAVLTTGRQDWGILRSTCAALARDAAFDLRLLVGGMHCSERFGATERAIAAEGFAVAERLAWPVDGRSAAEQAADALSLVAAALERQAPASLLLAGDRLETAAAALGATLARVPIVHLHGGEETQGAFDDALRHAITKLSHLHLVSHPLHAARVRAMGEDPRAVHVVGAPGLDNLTRSDLASRDELESFLGLPLEPPVVVVTVYPATLSADPVAAARAVAAAMDEVPATYVVTLPNADPGGDAARALLAAAARGERRRAVPALGERLYWGLLRVADALLGNSSSALLEAPAAGLPAVNVGDRQKGRLRGGNVVDVPADAGAVARGLRRALDSAFRDEARRAPSPFGRGDSAPRIVEILRAWRPPSPPSKPGIPVASDLAGA